MAMAMRNVGALSSGHDVRVSAAKKKENPLLIWEASFLEITFWLVKTYELSAPHRCVVRCALRWPSRVASGDIAAL